MAAQHRNLEILLLLFSMVKVLAWAVDFRAPQQFSEPVAPTFRDAGRDAGKRARRGIPTLGSIVDGNDCGS